MSELSANMRFSLCSDEALVTVKKKLYGNRLVSCAVIVRRGILVVAVDSLLYSMAVLKFGVPPLREVEFRSSRLCR